MKLQHPVSPFIITQPYGVNGAYYRAHGINLASHNGIDLQTYHGQPVYAAHAGDAVYQQDDNGGEQVIIWGKGIRTIYLHLCDPKIEPQYKSPIDNFLRNPVKTGDLIGYSDSTGFSTGTHLHFGCKMLNERGEVLNVNNGNGGAIDPMPFFEDTKLFPARYGETSENVKNIQKKLISLGYKITAGATGYYGPQTAQAIYAYQLGHISMSLYERLILKGKKFGPKTIESIT